MKFDLSGNPTLTDMQKYMGLRGDEVIGEIHRMQIELEKVKDKQLLIDTDFTFVHNETKVLNGQSNNLMKQIKTTNSTYSAIIKQINEKHAILEAE